MVSVILDPKSLVIDIKFIRIQLTIWIFSSYILYFVILTYINGNDSNNYVRYFFCLFISLLLKEEYSLWMLCVYFTFVLLILIVTDILTALIYIWSIQIINVHNISHRSILALIHYWHLIIDFLIYSSIYRVSRSVPTRIVPLDKKYNFVKEI